MNQTLIDQPSIKINRVEAGTIDKEKNKIVWKDERVSEVGDLYPTSYEKNFAEDFLNNARESWIKKIEKNQKQSFIFRILQKIFHFQNQK